MPELPEVETTRRGLAPHLQGRRVTSVTLRRPDLRWQARQQAASLADLLYLSAAQAHCLRESLYEELWQLQPGMPGQVQPDPAQAAALHRYHCSVVRALSPGQYSRLLRLEGDEPEPGALANR